MYGPDYCQSVPDNYVFRGSRRHTPHCLLETSQNTQSIVGNFSPGRQCLKGKQANSESNWFRFRVPGGAPAVGAAMFSHCSFRAATLQNFTSLGDLALTSDMENELTDYNASHAPQIKNNGGCLSMRKVSVFKFSFLHFSCRVSDWF